VTPLQPSGDAPETRVALATCSYFPDGDKDDAGIPAAIGGDVAFAIWDDPAVDWSTYDLVVIRSTWDYQGRLDDYHAWAKRLGDRLINPYDVIAWNTDKRYLRELADAGLPVVATELIEPGEAFSGAGGLGFAGEYVVKPTVSAGSRDTARFAPGEEARATELVAAIHASGRTAMVQPYIASVDTRGETATLWFDGAFSHAIHKGALLKPGAAPTSEVFAPETIEPREATAAERAVGERVLALTTERFGPLAYARIDLVEDADGNPMLLELELTEPSLFFAGDAGRVSEFAAAVRRRLPAV
jgi:glutathione synthase/RimK-type ligase-like ATP-grasp enzyme